MLRLSFGFTSLLVAMFTRQRRCLLDPPYPAPADSEDDVTEVYIGNIPVSASGASVKELLEKMGHRLLKWHTISEINVQIREEEGQDANITQHQRKFGFATFQTTTEAADCVEQVNISTQFQGRWLRAYISEESRCRKRTRTS